MTKKRFFTVSYHLNVRKPKNIIDSIYPCIYLKREEFVIIVLKISTTLKFKRIIYMFEQGVIRPPSEAASLLVRVTRNCPWNRCHFCPAYKGKRFSKRTVEEVKSDIDEMAGMYSSVSGGFQSAFLQDADSLIVPADELVEIITHIKKRFPAINRITTYARAKSMKRKTPSAYGQLMEAGLNRIHTGMESGSRNVLKMISKGITPEDIQEGGKRVAGSGISLSMYVMPGVGGRSLSREQEAGLLAAVIGAPGGITGKPKGFVG